MFLGCSSRSLALPWVKEALAKISSTLIDCPQGSYVREYPPVSREASSVLEMRLIQCAHWEGEAEMYSPRIL